MANQAIKVEHLNFSYGSKPVLENISFRINKGDYLGIIGENGGGKSTLVKIIVGLLKPQSGRIFLFEKPIDKFDEWQKIGFIPQNATSFDQGFPSSVEEIVGLGLLSTKGFPKFLTKNDRQAISSALKRVGMLKYKNSRISELSGGQQQRVFIAKTLVSKPELLILDEPTTGVDINARKDFYDMLRKLNRDEHITILIVSHDLTAVTKYVNKVACLNKKLLFHGTHKEFCSSKVVSGLFGHEKHIVCHTHREDHYG